MMFFAFKIIKAIDPSQSLGQLLFQDFATVSNNVINGLKAGLPISTLHELLPKAILLPNAVAIESNNQKNLYMAN
jgi:hypothetical protein